MQTITSYEVIITMTGKPMGRTDANYSIFDEEIKRFKTKEEVKAFLQERYNKVKKVPMYQDTANGETIKTGVIYCYKNKDWSHDSKPWYQQDWVTVNETTRKPIVL